MKTKLLTISRLVKLFAIVALALSTLLVTKRRQQTLRGSFFIIMA